MAKLTNKRPFAIIDVDLTFVDSVNAPHGWLQWLNAKTNQNLTADELNWNYNLAKGFLPHWPAHCTETPMDWWRYQGIYDQMKPMEGAVEALEHLTTLGYDVVFVSHCKGSHMKSKYSFLKKYAGHIMKGFVATKEKHLVCSGTGKDVVFDDRNDYLNLFDDSVRRFKIDNKWTQYAELNPGVKTVSGWQEFKEELTPF